MGNFFRVAALVLIGAIGVSLYELGGGEIMPAPVIEAKRSVAVAISKSPPPRLKSARTLDRSKPMPVMPPALARMIEAKGGSDFPVLIPQALARDEARVKQNNVRLRLTDDGYTSVLTLPDYDVVIYGTRKAFRKPSALKREKASEISAALVRADYTMRFEDGDDGRGGSLSFGRYGVDYHIEFFCHGAAEACVDEKVAGGFLEDMFKPYERAAKKNPSFWISIGISGSTTRSTTDPATDTQEFGTQQREAKP